MNEEIDKYRGQTIAGTEISVSEQLFQSSCLNCSNYTLNLIMKRTPGKWFREEKNTHAEGL